jgi:hypothetical protein
MEQVRGSDVVFDPIQAIIDGAQTEGDFGDKLVGTVGSLAGEVLSNVPMGAAVGSIYPEYGAQIGDYKLPSRADLFGESDPTRYGVAVPLVKAIQDPVKNLLLPWGGAQASKTLSGAKTMGLLPQDVLTEQGKTKETIPASVTKTGKIRTLVDPDFAKTAQALAFGGYASPEVRKFFEGTGVPFGEKQTANLMALLKEGIDANKLQQALSEGRSYTKKEDRLKVLQQTGFTKKEIDKIMSTFYGYKVGE